MCPVPFSRRWLGRLGWNLEGVYSSPSAFATSYFQLPVRKSNRKWASLPMKTIIFRHQSFPVNTLSPFGIFVFKIISFLLWILLIFIIYFLYELSKNQLVDLWRLNPRMGWYNWLVLIGWYKIFERGQLGVT